MTKNELSVLFFFFLMYVSFAQNPVLCTAQNDYVKIENSQNIPSKSNNSDGTITLMHQDHNITAILADYVIYDFYQVFPNSTGELFKYYTIVHGNRALINTLYNTVSQDVFIFDSEYEYMPISSNLIALLDEKVYRLTKYCSNVPEVGKTCETNEQNSTDEFDLKIAFNYDPNTDIILAETADLTSCGNSFSIGLKGGFDDGSGSFNILQLGSQI